MKVVKYFKFHYRKLKDLINLYVYLNNKIISKNQINSSVSQIDLVTIAFNNPFLIEYQIKLLKKNLSDTYFHIIADNSSNPDAKKKIEEICNKLCAYYVDLPLNPFKRNKSHGAAMHWVYKNILRKRKAEFFGFLDHDIFPTEPTSLLKKLNKGFYSRVMHTYTPKGFINEINDTWPYWSLWAGFYFIKSDLLSKQNIYSFNFFPRSVKEGGYLDTGGGLWDPLFSKIPYPGKMADFKQFKFRETINGNVQTDYYEMFDDWIHFVNISNWYETPDIEMKKAFVINKLEDIVNK